MRNDDRPLRRRFLDWYGGAPVDLPPFDDPAPPEPPRVPSRFHNKTIRERVTEWCGHSGETAFRYFYRTVSVLACLLIVGVLLVTVSALPPFGAAENPTNNEVPARYIEQGVQDTGAVNVVAGIILDYRAFDTLGESCVLFISACAVILLLRSDGRRDAFDLLLHEMEEPRHDEILKQIARILVPMIMTFGIYVVLGGHLGPGGGFSGGAIIGASMILYASAFGTRAARRFYSYRTFRRVVSGALGFYALAKGYSFFTGANHIPSGIPLGQPGHLLSAGLILPLNIAVGLIVSSVMYMFYILFSKGEMR